MCQWKQERTDGLRATSYTSICDGSEQVMSRRETGLEALLPPQRISSLSELKGGCQAYRLCRSECIKLTWRHVEERRVEVPRS